MMSPTGSAIASPPSEPSCYEDRPAEDDDVDLGVPDPVHRLVGARDVRGAVTVPGAPFERAAALTADSTSSARALDISRTCCAEVVNAYWYARTYCLPTRQALELRKACIRCLPRSGGTHRRKRQAEG